MDEQSKAEIINRGSYADIVGDTPLEVYGQESAAAATAQAEPEQTQETVDETQVASAEAQPAQTEQPASTTETPAPISQAEGQAQNPTQTQVADDWKTALKNVDKEEVLKSLGYDDFTIGLIKYGETTGDYTPYLEVKTKDWTKVSDAEIMRHNLKQQYAGLSEEEFELIYRDEVIDRFSLDPEVHDPNAIKAKTGAIKLKVEAEKVRQQLVADQAKFKAPERQVDQAAIQRQQEEEAAMIKANNEFLLNHPSSKALLANKRLELSGGDVKFNFEVADAQEILNMMVTPNSYTPYFTKPNGEPDVDRLLFMSAAIRNPSQLIKSLIDYGKSLGIKQTVDNDLHNLPDERQAANPPSGPSNMFDAFKKGNVVHGTYGG